MLKDEFGVRAKLLEGSGGVFDVTLDGEVIFSKDEQDRFPTNDEIVATVRDVLDRHSA